MEKYVSEKANFALYKPTGWKVTENCQNQSWSIMVRDPAGQYEAAKLRGEAAAGLTLMELAKRVIQPLSKQGTELSLQNVAMTSGKDRMVFDVLYTHASSGARQARYWISLSQHEYLVSIIEAPKAQFEAEKSQLLSILANIKIMKGGFEDAAAGSRPAAPTLKQHRLADGSASFSLPPDWIVQDLGKTTFLAYDSAGTSSFLVASTEVLTPRLGVAAPHVPVSAYLSPERALPYLSSLQGLLNNLKYLEVKPRPDINQLIGKAYTSGPVQSAELLYTFSSKQGECKGYTFGISYGSRLDTNWRFWHLTMTTAAARFEAMVPTMEAMAASYKINDQYAQNYIAQGMQRLHQMEQQTSALAARNQQEISSMMQAAYDERQRSQDYIDYQRTNYIRGEQDWISQVEGGTVYHTDTWGTTNTYTGETGEGAPFDYLHFTGDNPKYHEGLIPIDNRQLYESVFGK